MLRPSGGVSRLEFLIPLARGDPEHVDDRGPDPSGDRPAVARHTQPDAALPDAHAHAAITIYLTGQFMLAGECDMPRAKAQLEFTAMTAAGATRAAVFINGRPIDEVLSLK